jgi:photosystem II stability/assembly factor-like uncharacterized protein
LLSCKAIRGERISALHLGGIMKAPAKILSPSAVIIILLTFLSCAAFPAPVQAKTVNWKIFGPEGGQVNCFASPDATGTILYAGGDGGVYKSTDAGEHWQGLPKSPGAVTLLAVNPANANIVYAGWPQGVSRSTDGGRTWQVCLQSAYGGGVVDRPPTGLAVDPLNPQRVYATFNNTLTANNKTHGPFCYSTDGGQTWTESVPDGMYVWETVPHKIYNISSLAVDPFQPNIIYVTSASTKYRSQQDYGLFFRQLPPAGGAWLGGDNLYAEPDAQSVLYAYGYNGVARSNNWGDNWFETHAPSSLTRSVISHSGMGWAVLSASSSDGVTKGYYTPFTYPWTSFNYGLGNGLCAWSTILALQTHIPFGAFAGLACGVYRTDTMNNNGNWQPKNRGLTNADVRCLAVAPDPQHTLYAGTRGGGIFKSADRGRTWQAINTGLTVPEGSTIIIYGLAVEYPNYFKVYAATNVGLFRSIDGGATWSVTSIATRATSVVTDPQNAGTVYARAEGSSGYSETFISTTAGQTWDTLNPEGFNGYGLTLVNGPLTHPMYLLGGDGIYRQMASGEGWNQIFTQNCLSLGVTYRSFNIIYAGTYNQGLYKSIDFGNHWTPITAAPFNLIPQRQITAITVDPATSDVYVGMQNGTWEYHPTEQYYTMNSGGIWKSSDGGATWTDLGLPQYRGVNAAAVDFPGTTVYCGLADGGVAVSGYFKANLGALELLLLH